MVPAVEAVGRSVVCVAYLSLIRLIAHLAGPLTVVSEYTQSNNPRADPVHAKSVRFRHSPATVSSR